MHSPIRSFSLVDSKGFVPGNQDDTMKRGISDSTSQPIAELGYGFPILGPWIKDGSRKSVFYVFLLSVEFTPGIREAKPIQQGDSQLGTTHQFDMETLAFLKCSRLLCGVKGKGYRFSRPLARIYVR